MSDQVVSPSVEDSATRSRRGQSLVEFALVLPMLLVLLLGIADFGRVFSDGIILEAAARNAAELAAQEYVQLARNRAGGVLTAADYDRVHDLAVEAVCEEAAKLTNRTMSGGVCLMPVAAICVHDASGGDPGCGSEATTAPTECDRLQGPAWTAAIEQPPNGTPALLPYVEVRLCYRFVTLFNLSDLQLPLANGLSIGEIWLQRDRTFVGGIY